LNFIKSFPFFSFTYRGGQGSSAPVTINIIGAGISGLAAGCYLQQAGFNTKIFEKHHLPGGLCTSWQRGEYTFDGCAHWILGSDSGSAFYKIWSELLDMKRIPFYNHEERLVVELKHNKNKYGENVFHLYTDLNRLQAYMLELAPEDEQAIKDFIHPMRVMQQFDLPPIIDDLPLWQSIKRGIGMSRYLYFFYWFLRLQSQTNMTYARKFKNAFLRESFELLYDGEEVGLIIMMMPLSVFDKKSAGYPIGGSLKFAERMEQRYIELGGEIHYHTPVHKILTDAGKATGVVVRHQVTHHSDITISAADWHYTIFEALEGKYADDKAIAQRDLKGLEVFYSVIQFSFGIAMDLSHLPHFFRFPLEKPIVSPDSSTYDRMEVHIYNYDPTLAPKGKTAVMVSFYTKNSDYWINLRRSDRKAYQAAKKDLLHQVIPILDKKLGGVADKIEVIDVATPATFNRYTGNWKGSTQGWLPGANVLAPSPVGFTLPGLKNFYYSSHWNQPGGGLPVAVKTGRDIAQLIAKKYGRSIHQTITLH
jgi:phytoene dehydrogenase-like protein